ncbi:hypothetical protein KY347_05105 [Candidatus Woesearchaeota archaeon]|nr:hypothetical protein [Candidatus Woesearchaeota archaeon]
MNKKILIFGFKPYGKNKSNISEIIVKKLRNRKINRKVIFPIAFNRILIIEKIKEAKPDIILGLSQHPRARKIRIERRAKNIIRLKKDKKPRLISRNSKKRLFTNLKIGKTRETTIAYNAGTYACNFAMFNVMDYILKNKKDIKFAFLHIPKNYEIKQGIKIINKIIAKMDLKKQYQNL